MTAATIVMQKDLHEPARGAHAENSNEGTDELIFSTLQETVDDRLARADAYADAVLSINWG